MPLNDWNAFDSLRSSKKEHWEQHMPTGLTTRINIFKARFDIADRLESMTFAPDFTDGTTQAYLAGTKLLLAYSAGEAYMRAEDLFRGRSKPAKITTWSISRANLARDLRPLVELILEKANHHGTLRKDMKGYLSKFIDGASWNVRPVATALRHVHAHGGLTARSLQGTGDHPGAGYGKAMDDLAQVLLVKCNEKFSGLVGDLTAKLQAEA
jgi:hypothetical protein